MRQDLDRPSDRAAGGRGRRPGAVPGPRRRPRQAPGPARAAPGAAGGVPGPVRVAGPEADRVRHGRGVPPGAPARRRRCRPAAEGPGRAGASRAPPGRRDRQPLPASALRRAAAAARDRRGDGARPGTADRRRAGLDARRLAPGRGAAGHARPAGEQGDLDPVRHPRPVPGLGRGRSGRRGLPGPDRGTRDRGRDHQDSAAPLHPGPGLSDPGAGGRAAGGPDPAPRRGADGGEYPARLPVPSPLPPLPGTRRAGHLPHWRPRAGPTRVRTGAARRAGPAAGARFAAGRS